MLGCNTLKASTPLSHLAEVDQDDQKLVGKGSQEDRVKALKKQHGREALGKKIKIKIKKQQQWNPPF